MKSTEVRNGFLQFFHSKGLPVIPSSSLIPHSDPTLLFTSAGMVQFKANFMGIDKSLKNAATCQKCVRTTDIDSVGFTERHLTFFEMLGNFSFGDYFKNEAIAWAWEYLTGVLGISPDKLYVSIYKGGIAPRDEEAYNAWLKYVPKERIFELGEADNFWTMGPTGPCGPCSEIYYDFGDKGCKNPHCDITCDCGRFVEIWNIVFESYNRLEDGSLQPLPQNNIDTGMGLERLCMVMQHKQNIFETDLFTPLTDAAKKALHIEGKTPLEISALRIIADHVRSSSFLIAEGILPSNEGRGYILRRLIRRAARYAKLMGGKEPFLYTLAKKVGEIFEGLYPEIDQNLKHIEDVLKAEETLFLKTLQTGEEKLAELLARKGKTLSGKDAFYLHETFGFPLELTREIAAAKGIKVDEEGYEKAKEEASAKSRSYADEFSKEKVKILQGLEQAYPATVFTGYDTLAQNARVLALLNTEFEEVKTLSGEGYAVFDKTSFYAESGGQVGDTGLVLKDGQTAARILDVQKPIGKIFLHKVDGTLTAGDEVLLQVNSEARRRAAANHSAIHVINAALRQVFGDGVHQSGSYVSPQRLRFDYTLSKTPTAEEWKKVWAIVQQAIDAALPVACQERPLKDAAKLGAVTLLGETYADPARFVLMGGSFEEPEKKYSLELCAGTHVSNTAQIITVVPIKEGSLSAGVRRIEAVAGPAALDYLKGINAEMEEMAARLTVPVADVAQRLHALMDELREVKKRYTEFREKTLAAGGLSQVTFTMKNGATLVMQNAEGAQPRELRAIADTVSQKYDKAVIIVTTDREGKRSFVVKTVGQLPNTNALEIAKMIAADLNGRAGGRPDFAQGGGEAKKPWQEFMSSLKETM
ncbi:MAG TPA: alanine--tRNA ligase [Candidatus Avelusimicrobium excrementipullorum]|nr:alanine--tRNA ligase [Candidatus Avelusimicrobium excrementipullorum]